MPNRWRNARSGARPIESGRGRGHREVKLVDVVLREHCESRFSVLHNFAEQRLQLNTTQCNEPQRLTISITYNENTAPTFSSMSAIMVDFPAPLAPITPTLEVISTLLETPFSRISLLE